MKKEVIIALMATILFPIHVSAKESSLGAHASVEDKVITKQRAMLATNTKGKGIGPQ